MSNSVHTEIGEIIVILVNVLGWFVLAVILIVGSANVIRYLLPLPGNQDATEETF